jgi:protein-tyrosine phosphatase
MGSSRLSLYRIPTPVAGVLSTMPRPRGGEWLDGEMAALRSAGVGLVACLLTGGELAEFELHGEEEAARLAGIEFRHLPIVDMSVPSPEPLLALADELVGRLTEGAHVVIHCRAGIGRSSLVAATVLVGLGVPIQQAWVDIGTARGVEVPETEEQRRWVERHARPAPSW